MLTTRNSMRSMPGGPGRMNDAMFSAMFPLPREIVRDLRREGTI
jgi:hypothetical protein